MPQACRNALLTTKVQDGTHAGLILDRFLKIVNDSSPEFRDSRQELLRGVTSIPGKLGELYRLSFRQWNTALSSATARSDFKIQGRYVSGLGASSPIETGLRLHHTFGVPVIPGSTLKGLASHFCDQVWGEHDPEFKKIIKETDPGGNPLERPGRWFLDFFGTSEECGHIIFHDAWILPESISGCLQPDVMTVHHPDYYQQPDGGKGPTDFDDPTPIPFLSIRGTFRVAVSCDVGSEQGQQWADLALKLLGQAFEHWGIGGKTSAGYGRLTSSGGAKPAKPDSLKGPQVGHSPDGPQKKPASAELDNGKKAAPTPQLTKIIKTERVTAVQELKAEGPVLTADGVEILCRGIKFIVISKGEQFRAEVTRQNGKPVKAVFKSRM